MRRYSHVKIRSCIFRHFVVLDKFMFENLLPSLTDRISLSLRGLRAAVAERMAGNAVAVALITLIYFKLQRIEDRVLWLIAAAREGRLRGGWACPGRAPAVRVKVSAPPVLSLPRGFAWLVRLVPYKAAGYGSQLRHLFGDAEMVALLAASPQLRKALRPLCRMLGIEPALLVPVAPVAPVADMVSADGDISPGDPPAGIVVALGSRADLEVGVGSGRGRTGPGEEWWIFRS